MSEKIKPGVISFIPHYLPGYKAGGPVRALGNLVERMGEEFQFNIVTTDRDQGDSVGYQDVVKDQWVNVGKAEVQYLSPGSRSLKKIRNLLREFPSNPVHLTGLFSTTFSAKIFILIRLGLVKPKLVIIAPRGELCKEALASKRLKKIMYLFLSKRLGFYNNVIWHASSPNEREDIERIFGGDAHIQEAADFGPNTIDVLTQNEPTRKAKKRPGVLRIIFLGRITRSKNIMGALEMVDQLNGDIVFNIYGPIQDEVCWVECQRMIELLPSNIKVSYNGPVDPNKVADTFGCHDLFLFPTSYESFGHVVLESLSAGCPVLISDRTPWMDLEEQQVGWVVEYANIDRFREMLKTVAGMGLQEHVVYSNNAIKYTDRIAHDPRVIDAHRRLLGYVA